LGLKHEIEKDGHVLIGAPCRPPSCLSWGGPLPCRGGSLFAKASPWAAPPTFLCLRCIRTQQGICLSHPNSLDWFLSRSIRLINLGDLASIPRQMGFYHVYIIISDFFKTLQILFLFSSMFWGYSCTLWSFTFVRIAKNCSLAYCYPKTIDNNSGFVINRRRIISILSTW
jgi:hypothetical protein